MARVQVINLFDVYNTGINDVLKNKVNDLKSSLLGEWKQKPKLSNAGHKCAFDPGELS